MENTTSNNLEQESPTPTKHNSTPKVSKELISIILVMGVLLVGTGYIAGTQMVKKEEQLRNNATPSPTPPSSSFPMTNNASTIAPSKVQSVLSQADFYDISLPTGWQKIREEVKDRESRYMEIMYENMSGDYLQVTINMPGRGFGADELWYYEINNDENTIRISEQTRCTPESPMCTSGDNQLDIGIKNDNPFIKKNGYFFMAGNRKNEKGVDTAVYKEMLESMVFK